MKKAIIYEDDGVIKVIFDDKCKCVNELELSREYNIKFFEQLFKTYSVFTFKAVEPISDINEVLSQCPKEPQQPQESDSNDDSVEDVPLAPINSKPQTHILEEVREFWIRSKKGSSLLMIDDL